MHQEETINIPYTKVNFSNFLLNEVINKPGVESLRIYLASFQRKLGVVYATNDTKNLGQELFFLVSREDYNKVEQAVAERWIKEYQRCKLPVLKKCNPDLKFGDTVCITHKAEYIKEFWDEIYCQKPDGIRLSFCAYLNNDKVIDEHGNEKNYSNLLHVCFVFTQIDSGGVEREFLIDDCPNFKDRQRYLAPHDTDKIDFRFDNGTLCPPCDGCDGVTFPPQECAR